MFTVLCDRKELYFERGNHPAHKEKVLAVFSTEELAQEYLDFYGSQFDGETRVQEITAVSGLYLRRNFTHYTTDPEPNSAYDAQPIGELVKKLDG